MDAHLMPLAQQGRVLKDLARRLLIPGVLMLTFGVQGLAEKPKSIPRWPQPRALINQLESLSSDDQTAAWAEQTQQLLHLLGRAQFDDPAVEAIFLQLRQKVAELDESISRLSNSPGHSLPERVAYVGELRRVRYRIVRRLSIWEPVFRLAQHNFTTMSMPDDSASPFRPVASGSIRLGELSPDWQKYLLQEEIESAFQNLNPNVEQQRTTARRVLARMYSSVLNQQQQDFIDENVPEGIDSYLRMKALGELDLAALLLYIEANELNNSGVAQHRLNDQYQNLRWSSNRSLQALSSLIDTHYRNANFRLTVSEDFMNRLLPKMPVTAEPISDNILGAYVHGNNYVSSELHIGLIPDPQRIHLRLETIGEVNSNTLAHKSGFTMENEGVSRFQVFKRLAFDREGVLADRPIAFSENSNRLVGLRGKMDAIPILGWVAKRLAHQQIAAAAPETRQYFKQKVESEAKDRLQREVNLQLTQIRRYLYQNLMQPLIAMELEPTPLQMNTTHDQVVMRYRLAGCDQMAAFTSRPRELESALMSIQMHQSAVNNMLMRCDIAAREFTAAELRDHLHQVFRLQDQEVKQELDSEAQFEFTKYDPIRVDFDDDLVRIGLKLRSLQLEGGKKWKSLKVTVAYRPTVAGTKIKWVQEEKVRVKGQRLRLVDQVPVCAIFNTIFKDHYQMDTLPEQLRQQIRSPQLAIAQLVSGDGWIGISLIDPVRNRSTPAPQAQGRKVIGRILDNVRR